jgi:undecaprenyl-diphosphatase
VVLGGPLSDLDVWLAERLDLPRRSPFSIAALFWTNLNSYAALLAYGALFAALLARRRAWPWMAGLLAALPGGLLLNEALKIAVQTTPPVLDNPALALETASFPSGHAAGAILLYGFLAAYLGSRYPRLRGVWIAAAALLVVLVSYAGMALGRLYFGDALGALVSSAAWLVICLAGVHAWSAQRPR